MAESKIIKILGALIAVLSIIQIIEGKGMETLNLKIAWYVIHSLTCLLGIYLLLSKNNE
mgnify:CR=1 FL=1